MRKFTIFGIDGWFVIIGIVAVVLLASFYLSLLVVPALEKRRKILIQPPTGKRIRNFPHSHFCSIVEETSLLNPGTRPDQAGALVRVRRHTEIFLERIFYR